MSEHLGRNIILVAIIFIVSAISFVVWTSYEEIQPDNIDSFVEKVEAEGYTVTDTTNEYLECGYVSQALTATKGSNTINFFIAKSGYDAHSNLFMTVRNVFRDDTMSTKAPDQTYGKSYDSYTINGFSLISHTNVYRHVHRHADSVVVANCEYNPQDNIEAFVKSL